MLLELLFSFSKKRSALPPNRFPRATFLSLFSSALALMYSLSPPPGRRASRTPTCPRARTRVWPAISKRSRPPSPASRRRAQRLKMSRRRAQRLKMSRSPAGLLRRRPTRGRVPLPWYWGKEKVKRGGDDDKRTGKPKRKREREAFRKKEKFERESEEHRGKEIDLETALLLRSSSLSLSLSPLLSLSYTPHTRSLRKATKYKKSPLPALSRHRQHEKQQFINTTNC